MEYEIQVGLELRVVLFRSVELPDRLNRGLDQHRMPADDDQILDRSCPADDRPQLDRTLNPRLSSDWGIEGLHAVDDVALRPVGYFERMRGRRRGWRSSNIDRSAD